VGTNGALQATGKDDRSAGEPLRDLALYRRALGSFATGITVVTAASREGHRVGLTVNSFTSVSLDPPLVLWCQSAAAATLDVFTSVTHFAVNVLAADQRKLAERFTQQRPDRFAALDFAAGPGGAPILAGVSAWFECRTAGQHCAGDHVVHFGIVERYAHCERAPLILSRGRYGGLAETLD
jgi:flavin reductase (DIM6/NTAB) family NADH-FMN oxidoreductase RutF